MLRCGEFARQFSDCELTCGLLALWMMMVKQEPMLETDAPDDAFPDILVAR